MTITKRSQSAFRSWEGTTLSSIVETFSFIYLTEIVSPFHIYLFRVSKDEIFPYEETKVSCLEFPFTHDVSREEAPADA